ncbi:class I SAM-dependent methyltransferase [Thiohalophilus sp.]|uniref:class I SAM-dependent methyltransferase n=1 Tax=Thiohalophilus sp. TaxID=3028392 RepID=UPI002ACE08F7|nr:class I SAM-dependent methyltransferase [Thiohalophilus sp.]MDZ7663297.1 class I SAM-dependent methyltransferase [Thiohalophilus sp.]
MLYSAPVKTPATNPSDSLACPLCGHPAEPFCADRRRRFFRCPQCELISADPAAHLDRAEEKAVYDQHDNDPGDPRYRRFLAQLADPLLERLSPGMQGLDYGCGPGPTLSGMLREAGMVMHDYDPLYAPNTALLDRQYDFVTCTEVVEHFNDPATAWPQLVERVRPGGWLGIMTWLVSDPDPQAFRSWGYKGDPTHVSFYRPATFEWLGRTLGFEVEFAATRVILMHKPVG